MLFPSTTGIEGDFILLPLGEKVQDEGDFKKE